jgi:HEAT repeat protein
MAQVSQLSPELASGVLQLARALLTAARNWTLYPREHPAVGDSITRLSEAVRETSGGAIFSLAVTPDTLLVEGAPADRTQAAITEAAALLHACDIIQITFIGEVPAKALQALMTILALDAAERRTRGGPAGIWALDGHPSMAIDQIDYQKVLQREQREAAEEPEPARRDDLWRSIVRSISAEQMGVFDEPAQRRLLAIAGSAMAVGDMAAAVMAPRCGIDGSPMITSQAAIVLAAFRHLTSIVSVMSPERMPEVMGNLAAAATRLDPHVIMQVLRSEEDSADHVGVVRGMTAAFDDAKAARLLATALTLDGQASDRLAAIFNTIAPDDDRKQRVLTLTRNLLSETDFGRSGQFPAQWTSMSELLATYNDRAYVSEVYRASLDGVGQRAERLRTVDLPPELNEWMLSLGQENVRTLSVQLLIDLLAIERDEARAGTIAEDMAALAEDLLMSGAYSDAKTVTRSLAVRAGEPRAIGRDACRQELDRLGTSLAMRETTALIGDMDEEGWTAIRSVTALVGASAVEALKMVVMVEEETPGALRAAELIVGFGSPAVPRLSSLVDDPRWFVQRAAARMLGRIAVPDAVPLLQPLVRRAEPRVARDAIAALVNIDDPSAARAIHTVLRAAQGEFRRVVVDVLVADRDARVVPMLERIVGESEPLGKDHEIVLETLAAMGTVGSDQAVPALTTVIGRRGFFKRRKLRALKERGVKALLNIGGPRAQAALDEAGRTGDRMLKKIIAAQRTG